MVLIYRGRQYQHNLQQSTEVCCRPGEGESYPLNVFSPRHFSFIGINKHAASRVGLVFISKDIVQWDCSIERNIPFGKYADTVLQPHGSLKSRPSFSILGISGFAIGFY